MLSKLLIVKMARKARRLRPVLLMLVMLLALVANFLTPFHPRLQVAEAQVACCPVVVPGTSDLWLAGMPDGSTASGGDVAPTHSPVLVNCLPLTPGFLLSFTVTGAVSNGPCCPQVGPDGATEASLHLTGAENGISDTGARLNALMGVFLGPDRPDLTAAPGGVDWTVSGNENYTVIPPQLKQVFFIGDGRNAGGEVQKVVVPAGATRLFLGTMDGTGWFNNTGSFSVTVCSEPAQQPSPSCATSSLPGTSDLWLAGMPNGTTASGPTTGDVAPDHSPVLSGLAVAGGDKLNFTNITGGVSNGPCCSPIGPEGGEITPHLAGAEHGISNLIAPINSLIGVFLGPDVPSNSPAPATLDFSNPASRDFTTLSPLLKQAFFIGNGTTSGGTVQQFVVPMGATRLFLGTMDGTGWFNNTGSFSVTACRVDEPAPTTRTLIVNSLNPNSGVPITVSPNDNSGQGNGVTPFSRTYNNNTVVTLTAPATAGGNNFQKWLRDNVDFSTSLTINVTMDANHTLTAVYAPPPPPAGFNICIQDDSTSSFLKINTQTGDYFFESCRGPTLSGKGTVVVRGSTITLVHNTPDRRVNAEVDASQKRGNAGVQSIPLQFAFTLADRDITDNSCVCIR